MRFLRIALLVFALMAVFVPIASAQGSEATVFDEANVLSYSEEQEVQAAFDRVREETSIPLYAFLVTDTNVKESDRRGFLTEKARQAKVPTDAGVIVVAPNDRWSQVNLGKLPANSQTVYEAMLPSFRDGRYAAGLIAGAEEILNESGGSQSTMGGSSVVPALGGILLILAVVIGSVLFLRNRGRKKRELAESREAAEEEFAALTSRMEEFDEKERLVSGYLEAQRPLLDQATEEEIEAKIRNASATGFGKELNEAAARLHSNPEDARAQISHGRELLESAIVGLDESEKAIDDYRAADKALDGRLREAAEEIASAEAAEGPARTAGATVEPMDLRSEYDRLTKEVASRAAHRVEFDPRQALATAATLIERAGKRRAALEDEVSSKAHLDESRRAAQAAVERAGGVLEEYRQSYPAAEDQWGPAALEMAPAPEGLSSELHSAIGLAEEADRLEAAGRFAEARSRLEQARSVANAVIDAPGSLRAAVVTADRKKKEGEEKLRELEARLEQAEANEHLMSSTQRQQLREYEYQLRNARSGFFGGDWLTALLLFEALDHDYVFLDNASFAPAEDDWGGDAGSDWGGGDWSGGGDWGGGDWGGGGDFGGDW